MAYKTKNINGVNSVYLGDLGLKHGRISSQNSVPYIALSSVPQLLAYDEEAGRQGQKYKITSSMGGDSHQKGPRSHYQGVKVDIAPDQRAGFTSFSPSFDQYTRSLGGRHGAVGFEGDHYDIPIGSEDYYNSIKGNIVQNTNNNPNPQLMNADPNIANLVQTGVLTNDAYYQELVDRAEKLRNLYNIAGTTQNSEKDINRVLQENTPNIQQMATQGMDSPDLQLIMEYARNQQRGLNNALVQQQLNDMQQYNQSLPTGEENVQPFNTQVQQFLDTMNQNNPYVQAQLAGMQSQPTVDYDQYRKARNYDEFSNKLHQNMAIQAAAGNDMNLANTYLRMPQSNTAEDYLRNAQLQYQMDVANTLGIPLEQVQQMNEHQMKMTEAIAPGMISGYKEGVILQPNQNARQYMASMTPAYVNAQSNSNDALARAGTESYNRNNLIANANRPAADTYAQGVQDITKMYSKNPELVQRKFGDEMSAIGNNANYTTQGNSGMFREGIQGAVDNAGNINTNLTKQLEEQGKNERALLNYQQQLEQANQQANQSKQMQMYNQKINLGKKLTEGLINPNTGYISPGTEQVFINRLRSTGMYTEEEIADMVQLFYSNQGYGGSSPALDGRTYNQSYGGSNPGG